MLMHASSLIRMLCKTYKMASSRAYRVCVVTPATEYDVTICAWQFIGNVGRKENRCDVQGCVMWTVFSTQVLYTLITMVRPLFICDCWQLPALVIHST